jgi:hypothetical protein
MPKRCRVGEKYLLAQGEWLHGKERYQIRSYLGQGAFAAAYQAANERGEVCFIKEYFPPQRPSQAAELVRVYATERDVVRRIGNYELIPRFWDAFQFEGFSYLVTDYAPGPDLEAVLKSGQKPDVEVLTRWSVCLCHELSYLHSRNVVHHDLKPANVRLNQDGDPVIVDFSAAHWYRTPGETTDQLYGSDSFLAPEYTLRSAEDVEAGKQMDVFAMGRILVELMVGQRLSQDDINQKHDQLYGQILHSGKLDVSFVRAVFKSVAYDTERRYKSGVEMAEDITPAAPPVGRVRPSVVDFGFAEDTAPREQSIQAYNVGGGTLRAELAVEGDWVEIGTTGAVTSRSAMFERNRQTVRVVAYPERVPPGAEAVARIVFTFPNHDLEVPVRLSRTSRAAEVQVQPTAVRVNVPPGGFGQSRLTFSNNGSGPASIRLSPPVEIVLGITPEEFVIPPGGKQEVVVSIDAGVLGDSEASTEIRWSVDGNPRPSLPFQAGVRRGSGLLSALSDRFRKK